MSRWRPFVWLHSQRLRHGALYWLVSLGILDDTHQGILSFVYTAYTVAFALVWVVITWGALLSLALHGGSMLSLRLRDLLLTSLLPIALHWLVAVIIVGALLVPPWRLAEPDLQHAGVSPERTAPVVLSFLPRLMGLEAAVLAIAGLVTVALTQSLRLYGDALLALAPTVAIALALAWALGLMRFMTARKAARAALWCIPLALVVLASWLAHMSFDPGFIFAKITIGLGSAVASGSLWLGFIIAAALMLAAAARTNMTLLADASFQHAERQAIAAVARFDPALAAQLRRQAAFARKRTRFQLPQADPRRTFLYRSVLVRVRHLASLWGIVRAALVLMAGCALVLHPQPGLTWLVWLTFSVFYAPATLVEQYEQDMHPFMRQFLPQRRLVVFALDALLPSVAVLAIALGLGFILHLSTDPLALIVLVIGFVSLAGATQSLRVTDRVLAGLPAPDQIATVVAFGLVLLASRLGSYAAAGVALLLSVLLLAALGRSDAARSEVT